MLIGLHRHIGIAPVVTGVVYTPADLIRLASENWPTEQRLNGGSWVSAQARAVSLSVRDDSGVYHPVEAPPRFRTGIWPVLTFDAIGEREALIAIEGARYTLSMERVRDEFFRSLSDDLDELFAGIQR